MTIGDPRFIGNPPEPGARWSFVLNRYLPATDPGEVMLPMTREQIESVGQGIQGWLAAALEVAFDAQRPTAERHLACLDLERVAQAVYNVEKPVEVRGEIVEIVNHAAEGIAKHGLAVDDAAQEVMTGIGVVLPASDRLDNPKTLELVKAALDAAKTNRGGRGKVAKTTKGDAINALVKHLRLPAVADPSNLSRKPK